MCGMRLNGKTEKSILTLMTGRRFDLRAFYDGPVRKGLSIEVWQQADVCWRLCHGTGVS